MFEHFGIKDAIDIFLVALLLFYCYRLLDKSGTKPLFIGVLAFLSMWALVNVFNLTLLGEIMKMIQSGGFVVVVILFQEQIRRFLVSLGSHKGWKYVSSLFASKDTKGSQRHDAASITPIVLACMNMSKNNVGALIVMQQDIYLGLYEQTGEMINADISSRLIENLFFKNSPLHDGAMIIANKRIKAAGCILPVSQNPNIPKHLGLRHRSGLGISQETDAKVIIISEERGKISFAHNGKLVLNVSPEDLQNLLLKES